MRANIRTADIPVVGLETESRQMAIVESPPLRHRAKKLVMRGIARLMALVVMHAVAAMGAARGSDDNTVEIRCHRQSRIFQCTVGDKEVSFWDVDKSQIATRFRIPPAIVGVLPKEKVYWTFPTRTTGLVALTTPSRHVVFDAHRNAVVSDRATESSLRWYYHSGDKTLLVGWALSDENRNAIKAYDAISGKEARQWQYTWWQDARAGSWDVMIWERFHPKGFICVVMDDQSKRGAEKVSGAIVKDPQGREVAIPPYRSVLLWDLDRGKEKWRIDRRYPEYFAEFSADARRLVIISKGILEVWDTETGNVLARCDKTPDLTPIAGEFSPCAKYVSCEMCSENPMLWDWEGNSIKQVYRIPGIKQHAGLNGPHYRTVFSSDGKRIAIVARDLKVYEFETMTGELLKTTRLLDGASHQEVVFPEEG